MLKYFMMTKNILRIINKTSDKQYRKYDQDLKKLFDDILLVHKMDNQELSVIFVKDRYIKNINNQYRNKNYATDVISFASIDDDSSEEDYLGDIFINVDACLRQASDLNHSFRREFNFLFMHGVLHCLGYDHQNIKQEKQMFDLQHQLIKDKGYLNEEI